MSADGGEDDDRDYDDDDDNDKANDADDGGEDGGNGGGDDNDDNTKATGMANMRSSICMPKRWLPRPGGGDKCPEVQRPRERSLKTTTNFRRLIAERTCPSNQHRGEPALRRLRRWPV